jgi:hypothetical protein
VAGLGLYLAGKERTYATVKYECDGQTVSAQTQQSGSHPKDAIKADIARLYGDTHPFIDEPLPELKKAVHELGGLKPAAAEEETSELLAKVGARADELLKKVPDLISDESVSQTRRPLFQGTIPGCIGGGCFAEGPSSVWDREFNYLIVTHSALDGRLVLQEYRTNRKGKEVQGDEAPNFQGFHLGLDCLFFRESIGITLPIFRTTANRRAQYVRHRVCANSWLG